MEFAPSRKQAAPNQQQGASKKTLFESISHPDQTKSDNQQKIDSMKKELKSVDEEKDKKKPAEKKEEEEEEEVQPENKIAIREAKDEKIYTNPDMEGAEDDMKMLNMAQ